MNSTSVVDDLTNLVIVGAGGHGRETLDIVEAINRIRQQYNFVGFLADGPPDEELLRRRHARFVPESDAFAEPGTCYVIGIGDVAARRRMDERFGGRARAVSLVHPQAVVSSDNVFAAGVLIAAGSHVTTNVRLGRHTHVNVGAVVSHDCRVGNYVSLSPGALVNGNVTIEHDVFVGTGAIVLPGRHIGRGATIGAGAVVTRDVSPGSTVVGCPAREL